MPRACAASGSGSVPATVAAPTSDRARPAAATTTEAPAAPGGDTATTATDVSAAAIAARRASATARRHIPGAAAVSECPAVAAIVAVSATTATADYDERAPCTVRDHRGAAAPAAGLAATTAAAVTTTAARCAHTGSASTSDDHVDGLTRGDGHAGVDSCARATGCPITRGSAAPTAHGPRQ